MKHSAFLRKKIDDARKQYSAADTKHAFTYFVSLLRNNLAQQFFDIWKKAQPIKRPFATNCEPRLFYQYIIICVNITQKPHPFLKVSQNHCREKGWVGFTEIIFEGTMIYNGCRREKTNWSLFLKYKDIVKSTTIPYIR